MYPHRKNIEKMMREIKQEDQRRGTIVRVKDVRQSEKQRRPSIVDLARSLQWLVPRFEPYEPERWWMGAFNIILRLCQSSMMVVFRDQAIQASFACCIAQLGVCSQRNLMPYRRQTDNETAFFAQWLIFGWCMVLLMRIVGSLASVPPFLVGLVIVLATVALVARSLWTAIGDIKKGFSRRGSGQDESPVDDADDGSTGDGACSAADCGDGETTSEIELVDLSEMTTTKQRGESSSSSPHAELGAGAENGASSSSCARFESSFCAVEPSDGPSTTQQSTRAELEEEVFGLRRRAAHLRAQRDS